MPEVGTVLVADPDLQQQQFIAEILRSRYRVIAARTIADTIQMLVTYRPTILLLEVNQPDGDGVELIRRLRQDNAMKSMVIACVTNRSTVKDKVVGFQAGADDYIIKPVNRDTFMWRLVLLMRLRHIS